MTALLIFGSLACISWLVCLFNYIVQRMVGNYEKSMDVYLYQMYSFVVFSIFLITYIAINNQ